MREPNDLITQLEAARLTNKTISAIGQLIIRKRITAYEKFGKKLVSRSEVLNYNGKRGKPSKEAKAA